MKILPLLFMAVTVILSSISLVYYFRKRSGSRRIHMEIMSHLAPVRTLSVIEREKFSAVYGKLAGRTLGEGTSLSVYRHEGPIESISLSVNHAEVTQYTIGGIQIAAAGLERLGTLQHIDFKTLASRSSTLSREKAQAALKEYLEHGRADEAEAELKRTLDDLNHMIEVVFLNNRTEQAGFLVRYDDWNLAET
ncbi:MAG TPA: hypothetical protein ENN69_02320 [Spirochaetia bacterium]|mgnify:CR=1 FL=1|nr:hypothetical protein [Spirochaetia bacterium]